MILLLPPPIKAHLAHILLVSPPTIALVFPSPKECIQLLLPPPITPQFENIVFSFPPPIKLLNAQVPLI